MELVMGCQTKRDLQQLKRFLIRFSVVWPGETDFAFAYDLLLQHRFQTGLGIPDCLIASQALNQSAILYSFNAKHFSIVDGLSVGQPYERPVSEHD